MALSNENSVKKQQHQPGSDVDPTQLGGLVDLLSELMGGSSSAPPAPPPSSTSDDQVVSSPTENLRTSEPPPGEFSPAPPPAPPPVTEEEDELEALKQRLLALSQDTSPPVSPQPPQASPTTQTDPAPDSTPHSPQISPSLTEELLDLFSTPTAPQAGQLPPQPQTQNGPTIDLPSTSVQQLEDTESSDDGLGMLQSILVAPEVTKFRQLNAILEEKLQLLEHQIYDPESLIQLLLPWIAEILSLKVTESKEEVVEALVPIIDEVIKGKSHLDRKAMSEAIAVLLPEAIAHEIENSPKTIAKAIGPEIGAAIREQIRLDRDEIAQALAPEMGRAIKEQIAIERDAMVDALYPVIGSTVARYIAEALQDINQKIQNALSWEGVQRKIQAKVQGVSEAELVFKDAIPFTVQAIFLIHKGSGLVITDVQPNDANRLESEMVAGMLTAIRSFVNDCIAQAGENAELDVVEYGASKIMIEVAGYCYLAVVMKGEPPKLFTRKVRDSLGTIVLKYGKPIENYEGDPDSIPGAVQSLLVSLIETEAKKKDPKFPVAVMTIVVIVIGLITIPFAITSYRYATNRRLTHQANEALAGTPELAIYGLRAQADGSKKILELTGNVPNEPLREKAQEIAQAAVPTLTIDNKIIAVDIPPDPTKIATDVKRLTETLNQMKGVSITAKYASRKVTVTGTVMDMKDAQIITTELQKIPGVQSVISTIKLDPLTIATRLYFEAGSTQVQPAYQKILQDIHKFLIQYPDQNLKIIGHADPRGKQSINQKIALKRAEAVRDALILQGVDPKRLQIEGKNDPPKDVESGQPLLLSRCVIFELFTPTVPQGKP